MFILLWVGRVNLPTACIKRRIATHIDPSAAVALGFKLLCQRIASPCTVREDDPISPLLARAASDNQSMIRQHFIEVFLVWDHRHLRKALASKKLLPFARG